VSREGGPYALGSLIFLTSSPSTGSRSDSESDILVEEPGRIHVRFFSIPFDLTM
jgi:hypothetical protein